MLQLVLDSRYCGVLEIWDWNLQLDVRRQKQQHAGYCIDIFHLTNMRPLPDRELPV